MKKNILFSCIVLIISLFFVGCSLGKPKSISEIKGVTMKISDVTKTGCFVTITDTTNSEYKYGSYFRLDSYINNEWKELPLINDEIEFNDKLYEMFKDVDLEFSIDWEYLYGELESGTYRFVYELDNKYIAQVFTV